MLYQVFENKIYKKLHKKLLRSFFIIKILNFQFYFLSTATFSISKPFLYASMYLLKPSTSAGVGAISVPVLPAKTLVSSQSGRVCLAGLLTTNDAKRAMPHAPPSPAVSITEMGELRAAARNLCPTPLVLNKPPCPVMRSIFTFSSLMRMSLPIFNTPIEP